MRNWVFGEQLLTKHPISPTTPDRFIEKDKVPNPLTHSDDSQDIMEG
jgi:hypothetical protein